jgi:hypothetical protein
MRLRPAKNHGRLIDSQKKMPLGLSFSLAIHVVAWVGGLDERHRFSAP